MFQTYIANFLLWSNQTSQIQRLFILTSICTALSFKHLLLYLWLFSNSAIQCRFTVLLGVIVPLHESIQQTKQNFGENKPCHYTDCTIISAAAYLLQTTSDTLDISFVVMGTKYIGIKNNGTSTSFWLVYLVYPQQNSSNHYCSCLYCCSPWM